MILESASAMRLRVSLLIGVNQVRHVLQEHQPNAMYFYFAAASAPRNVLAVSHCGGSNSSLVIVPRSSSLNITACKALGVEDTCRPSPHLHTAAMRLDATWIGRVLGQSDRRMM